VSSGVLTGLPGVATVEAPRRDFHDFMVRGLLILFTLFFFLGNRTQALGLPGRMEDVIYIFLLPFSYRYLTQRKTVLFWLIAAYFSISFLPYLASVLADNYDYGLYPIIAIKELQYFYVAWLICQDRSRWVLGTVDVMAIVLILNGVRLAVTGQIDYYGIGTFATFQSPSLAGALYLFSTIWLHIRSKLLPSRVLRLLALGFVIVGGMCTIATVSRSSILGLIVYTLTYLTLTASVLGFVSLATAGWVAPKIITAIAMSLSVGYGLIALRLLRRWSRSTLSTGASRASKWDYYLGMLELPEWVVGKGKGYPNALDGTFGLGVDSQYVRTILENGVVGMILLAAIMLNMLLHIKRDGGEFHHAWALMLAMLVFAIPMEALMVSKSGTLFWLIMFYLYFCQRRGVVVRLPADPSLRSG
jgi:hypothetical protein